MTTASMTTTRTGTPEMDPSAFFVPIGYRTQPKAVTLDDPESGKSYWCEYRITTAGLYQYWVYKWGATLARREGLKSAMDVGCGICTKMRDHIEPIMGDTVGVDQRSALLVAREQGTRSTLVEADLESPMGCVRRTFDLIICADVLEHLADPDGAMEFIRACSHVGTRILFSTPDRDRVRGRGCMASPKPEHVREWSVAEFARLLESRGFEIVRHRLLPPMNERPMSMRRGEREYRAGARVSPMYCQAALVRRAD